MIAMVVVLLVAVAITGWWPARRGSWWAALPVVLLGAAAVIAVGAPTAHGFGLGAVRVAAVAAAMAGGTALATAAFVLAGATGRDATPTPDAPAEAQPDSPAEAQPDSPLRGGLAIGVLERAAIAVCVLTNFSAGLAVVVAAKSLARYPELRHPGAAEQFIIGTFVSVLWACACAGVAVALAH